MKNITTTQPPVILRSVQTGRTVEIPHAAFWDVCPQDNEENWVRYKLAYEHTAEAEALKDFLVAEQGATIAPTADYGEPPMLEICLPETARFGCDMNDGGERIARLDGPCYYQAETKHFNIVLIFGSR